MLKKRKTAGQSTTELSSTCPKCDQTGELNGRTKYNYDGREKKQYRCDPCRNLWWVTSPLQAGCPECGCDAAHIIKKTKGWTGEVMVRWGCDNCALEFTKKEELKMKHNTVEFSTPPRRQPTDGIVRYVRPLVGGATCPQCDRFPVPVTRTKKKNGLRQVRQHKCPDCGWTGQSEERLEKV